MIPGPQWWAGLFTQFTELNVNLFQRHPHRHTPKLCLPAIWVSCSWVKWIQKFNHQNDRESLTLNISEKFLLPLTFSVSTCFSHLVHLDIITSLLSHSSEISWVISLTLNFPLYERLGMSLCQATLYNYRISPWESKITYMPTGKVMTRARDICVPLLIFTFE